MIDKGYVVVYNEGVGGSSPRKLSELKVGAADEGAGGLQSVQPGANITIDNTDPQNPVVSASGGGSSNPPKPIDLRPQPGPVTLSVDESSTVTPTITGLTYSADFSAGFGMSVIKLGEGEANGWWMAWKPTTGVTGTINALVFTDATLGDLTYGYVHGVGLQVQSGGTPPVTLDADFSPNDTVVAGVRSDGSYWVATSNVPLASFPATPPLSISSIRAVISNMYAGAATLSGEIIVDKDLLDSTLKGYVESEGLPPFGSTTPASLPSDTAVGDIFYVTHGGTLQGVEYKDPDVNGNHDGFIIDDVAPLKITPCVLAKPATATVAGVITDAPSDGKQYARKDGDWEEVGGSFLGDVKKSVGTGGDFADLDELQAWMNANSGRFLTVDVLGEVASPSGAIPALTNQSFLQLTLNGVSGSALNAAYFFGNIGLSGQFTVKGNVTFTSYVPNLYNSTVTLSKNSNEIVELFDCAVIGGIIIYDGELRVTSSTFYTLKAEKITLNNCDVYLCEAVTDTYLFLGLRGFNDIGTVDAKSYTIDYLMEKNRTSSTIGYVNNDTNVSSLLNGGAINVYNKDGYVVVGNK